MHRTLGFWILATGLNLACCTASAWAAPAEGNAPAAVYSSFVELRLNIASSLPAGSILTCKAEIVPGTFDEPDRGFAFFGRASGATTLRETTISPGAAALCTLEIPFSWTGNRAPRTLILRYEIDGASPAGLAVLQKGLSTALRLAPSPAVQIVHLNVVAAP
jgi:hypothetical protein